jgi:hypothetical protein
MPKVIFSSSICERVDPGYRHLRARATGIVESHVRALFAHLNFGDVDSIELIEWVPAEDNPITTPQFRRSHAAKRIDVYVPMDINRTRRGDADPDYAPYLLKQFEAALQALYSEQQQRLASGKKR